MHVIEAYRSKCLELESKIRIDGAGQEAVLVSLYDVQPAKLPFLQRMPRYLVNVNGMPHSVSGTFMCAFLALIKR